MFSPSPSYAGPAIPTPFTSDDVERAYRVIDGGGLVLIKLDIGYGFAGRSDAAIERMYRLKGRSATNPCVVPGDVNVLQQLCPHVAPSALEWAARQAAWTTLSVIADLDTHSRLWQSLPGAVRQRCSKDDSVAVFLRAGAFVEALLAHSVERGSLFVGSSANISGQGNVYRPEDLAPHLVAGVDLFIDHGTAFYENPGRLATTMVDLRTGAITRRGVNAEPLAASLIPLRTTLAKGHHD